MYLEKLRQFQPVAMQILENSLVNNQLSHAYLFSGAKGTLTKEAAILLADRKSTRLNSSHLVLHRRSRMPSSE